jgi:hypothetical protein
MIGHRLQQLGLVHALAPRRRVHFEYLHFLDGDRATGAAAATLVYFRVIAWYVGHEAARESRFARIRIEMKNTRLKRTQ